MKFRGVDLAFVPGLARLAIIQRGEPAPKSDDVTSLRNRASGMAPWLSQQFGQVPGITITDHHAGELRIREYKPEKLRAKKEKSPAILHRHGGGMIMSTIEAYDQRCSAYAKATGFPVYSVDYRLAPEHPYPAATDDCFTAFQWVLENSESLRIDSRSIALLGNSAGSGLAAALALKLRDSKSIQPSCQVLIYPMLDHRTVTVKSGWEKTWLYWTFQDNRTAWNAYLSDLPKDENPPIYAVPALAANLSGLPKTYICVGTADIFIDEDLEFAQRLQAAGVATVVEVIEGAPHNFDYLTPHCPQSRRSWRSRFTFLVDHIQN
jgi:acetyl esterase/lipase